MMMSPIRLQGSYDDVKKLSSQPDINPEVVKLIAQVDEQVADLKMNIINFRINGKHDDIKKCECGGDLSFSNGKTAPISYTAQFTEDGKLYVEVAGLK